MSQLCTDWLCIATEGDTVDRRELKREWLIDAAETYDPELYAALIWPEHERDYGNGGCVKQVMWQEGDDGLVRLYAKISPNMSLIEANKRDQLLYFSVELTEDGNFRGTGAAISKGWRQRTRLPAWALHVCALASAKKSNPAAIAISLAGMEKWNRKQK